jgi:hypothetical protein
VHRGLVERGEVAPAARVHVHPGVEQRPHDVGAVQERELPEDPSVVVPPREAQRGRRSLGELDGLAARHGEYRGVDRVELGRGAARLEQLVRGEVAAAGGERQRAAPPVPAVPGAIHIGPRLEQHRDDREAAAAAERVMEAVVGAHVGAALEEPAHAGDVLEVELVVDHRLEPRLEEALQQRRVGLLARVVEGVLAVRVVLVPGGSDVAEYRYWI